MLISLGRWVEIKWQISVFFYKTSLCWIFFLPQQWQQRRRVPQCWALQGLELCPPAGPCCRIVLVWCSCSRVHLVTDSEDTRYLLSVGKLNFRPWILFPREEVSCSSCILLVNEMHKHFTCSISPVWCCRVCIGGNLAVSLLDGCGMFFIHECVKKIKNHRKVIQVLYLKLRWPWVKVELTFAYQGEEYFIAGVISRQRNLK